MGKTCKKKNGLSNFLKMQQRTLKHNAQLKKKSFFSLKMWKTVIQGQNHTKHKVEPSLNLDFFYFS